MGGRPWKKWELEFIEDNADRMLARNMAKKLGRSKEAVLIMMGKLGVSGFRSATDLLTQNKVCEIMGVTTRTVWKWERDGLFFRKNGCFKVVSQKCLVKFLIEHPDLWNAAKVQNEEILIAASGKGRKTFQSKQKQDKTKPYNWTTMEEIRLKRLYQSGISITEIARQMGRSRSSVNYKLSHMRDSGRIVLDRGSPIKRREVAGRVPQPKRTEDLNQGSLTKRKGEAEETHEQAAETRTRKAQ